MQSSRREALLSKQKVGAKEPVAELQAGGNEVWQQRKLEEDVPPRDVDEFNGIFKGVTRISVLK
jgi:hypothetical protein